MTLTDVEQRARHHVYRTFLDTGRAPTVAESAEQLGLTHQEVAAARQRLADLHALALQTRSAEVWMAHPFSAVPTGYRVVAEDGRRWWANCGWDAVAIPTIAGVDAAIEAVCPDCGRPFELAVQDGAVRGDEGVVQFCVPPSRFWDDIGFT